MSESLSQPILMVRGLGGIRTQAIQSAQQALDDRLKRCELELTSVLKLDEKIDVFEVEISRLRSMFLDKNPVFKDLIEELKQWNLDVRALKQNAKPIARSNYRYQLIKNLHYNLREVVNTRDRDIQNFYLMQLRAWYYNQSNCKTRPQTQQQNSKKGEDIGSILSPNGDFDGSGGAIEINQVDLTDYFFQRRSKHTHIDPPQDRIREFTKKELDFREGLSSSQGTRPGTVAFSQTRPHTQGSFARPSTNHQSMRGTGMFSGFDAPSSRGASRGGMTTAQSLYRGGGGGIIMGSDAQPAAGVTNGWEKEKEKLRSPGMISSNISAWNYTGSIAFFQSNPAGGASATARQQFQSIKFKNSSESVGAAGNDEEGEEGDEGEGEGNTTGRDGLGANKQLQSNEASVLNGNTKSTGNLLFAPSRKNYTSDANTIQSYASSVRAHSKTQAKSTFLNYVPSNTLGEIRLENMWLTNRNRAVKEKREHEELNTHMQVWSHNKGIFDQEINQKNQLTAHGSNFQEIGVKKNSKGAAPELSENNYLEKEKSSEEIEESEMMNNYLTMLRKPKAEKEAIGQHHQGSDESIFEIAQKIDQSIRSPRSGRSSRGADDFSESLNRSIDRQNIIQNDADQIKKAKNASDKTNEIDVIEAPVLPQRPKTTYVNLRREIHVSATPEEPFIDLEAKIKREKFIKLKESKGKIIGLSQPSLGSAGAAPNSKHHQSTVTTGQEEVDDEEIQRRKEHSLQLHHRRQEYGLVGQSTGQKSSSGGVGGKSQRKFRPFTSMYKRISLDSLREEQMSEIQSVRKNFAKKGIKCSLNTLTQSLSRFEGLPAASLQLPAPGSMLFVNPFDNFGKKKASKKKK